MLSAAVTLGGPGIIENAPRRATDAARRHRRSSHVVARRRVSSVVGHLANGGDSFSRRPSMGRDNAVTEVHGIPVDRLTYINTALDALPGIALREYFVPIMRLKKQLLLRQRNTRECFPPQNTAVYAKAVTDAVTSLAKALSSAGGDLVLDGGSASLTVVPQDLVKELKGQLLPICMEAGGVLTYPREPPEASFVYVILSGAVTATYFQPQVLPQQAPMPRRAGGGGNGNRKERQTYFTSAKDVVRLCGGGVLPDAAFFQEDANGTDSATGGGNNTISNIGTNNNNNGPVETASMSNVTSAIQRSLRRASRTVGQPTLQFSREEQLHGPTVLGAAEALGLAPSKYVSYTAAFSGAPAPPGPAAVTLGKSGLNAAAATEAVVAFRVRTAAVHAALIKLAEAQQAERQQQSPRHRPVAWCAAPVGEVAARGVSRNMADFVVAAHRRTLYNDYAATELLMRQSWLLQDAPSHTIRTLISHLEPRTYMPGEIIACPHTPGWARQLCFLRRGRLSVYALHKSTTPNGRASMSNLPSTATAAVPTVRDGCDCWHLTDPSSIWKPSETVESGASFGELSVLFSEPRSCVLRADTVCDVWCLPYRSFTRLMQRDASLRDGLLQKAAVLRIEWMGEQRFTHALAHQLRASSELLHPLSDIAMRLVQERLEPVVYAPGSLVVSTSTKCTEMIFLMRGSVTTICQGIATYGPGDLLGEGCLVPHRWPLGLTARSMVEGWRIKADQLHDAFKRMDVLHEYSGLVTSQTPQLVKQIFGTPQPEIEVDAVGRQRMPTIDAAPGGMTYAAYGRAVSEVQLKALCVLYRDYVREEDINYSTIETGCTSGGGAGGVRMRAPQSALDELARKLAIRHMEGTKGHSVAAELEKQQQQQQHGRHCATLTSRPSVAFHAGDASGKERATSPESSRRRSDVDGGDLTPSVAAAGSGRNAVRVNAHKGRGRPRSGGCRGPRDRVSSAGAFLVSRAFLTDNTKKAAGGAKSTTVRVHTGGAAGSRDPQRLVPLPPRLQQMARLLEERNRVWISEQRHEQTLVQMEATQREAAVRDQMVWLAASSKRQSAAGRAGEEDRYASRTTAASDAVDVMVSSAAATQPTLGDVRPAPVHIFLQAEKPKYELGLSEAISIGYVMQLPDISHIQYSVSLIDPDVALGPPAQRARRHLMSVTANDRYTKHNFLFAAASLEDGVSLESQKAAAKAVAEVTLKSKTRKLYTMMRSAVAARMDADGDLSTHTPRRRTMTSGGDDYIIDHDGSHAMRQPDTLLIDDELQLRSPRSDGDGDGDEQLGQSPPINRYGTSPDNRLHRQHPSPSSTAQKNQRSPPAGRDPNPMATPSPYRDMSTKSASQKAEEAFVRLLQRDPIQGVDLLRKHYDTPWGRSANATGLGSGMSTPIRQGTEARSTSASGLLSSRVEGSIESRRRLHRPSLLDRLETALRGDNNTNSTNGHSVAAESAGLTVEGTASTASNTRGVPDTEESGVSGGAVLTNQTATTFVPLVTATARDRWHAANQLQGSSGSLASGGDVLGAVAAAVPGHDSQGTSTARKAESGGIGSGSSFSVTAAPVEAGALSDYLYCCTRRRHAPALFVEGYGPLQPLSEEWAEYPPALRVAAAGPDTLVLSDRDGASVSMDRAGGRLSRPATSMTAAAAVRRSASRSVHAVPLFRRGEGNNGFGAGAEEQPFGGAAAASACTTTSGVALPIMDEFVMPDAEDTEVVIRRIQRDVNGLNAVAREQRRERDNARLRNGRIAKHRAAVEAALGKPVAEEQELLETWRTHFERIDRDAMQRASLPAALREEAGPDYMNRELKHLAEAPVSSDDPLWRYTNEMRAWQEQQQLGRSEASPLLNAVGGGALALVSGSGTAGTGATRDGPQRVVAAIGTTQLGFAAAPLQNPATKMDPAAYEAWVRQREDFFTAYKHLLGNPSHEKSEASPALAPPALHFATEPPLSTSTGHAQPDATH